MGCSAVVGRLVGGHLLGTWCGRRLGSVFRRRLEVERYGTIWIDSDMIICRIIQYIYNYIYNYIYIYVYRSGMLVRPIQLLKKIPEKDERLRLSPLECVQEQVAKGMEHVPVTNVWSNSLPGGSFVFWIRKLTELSIAKPLVTWIFSLPPSIQSRPISLPGEFALLSQKSRWILWSLRRTCRWSCHSIAHRSYLWIWVSFSQWG